MAAAAPPPPPPPAAAPPTPGGRKRAIVAVAATAALLLVGVGVVLAAENGDGSGFFGLGSGDADTDAPPPIVASFEGRVQGARAPIVGGLNTGATETQHVVSASVLGRVAVATLNWTASGPGAADSLVLILEVQDGDAWTEVMRGEGGPGLVVETGALTSDRLRARVFAGGTGAVDQAYTLDIVASA